ncbi:bifunctional heptose 7-phosphate kinase/heptose 1-phosphate adenyltransferase [uncultured Prochlorococcus sp.]|uniref:bifunctional heptose 7-phosphate kinase/heptose 1-phosphate adenyltransferase n=1 Tax=uncultured Prochlorococcus sp. TaxID=159733 RepID=UPI0025880B6F|nr:bifunctional heptose 7-phosphate kinase/heptose 1-phosphate adenyltransferase [uncultured Prochlorococcus sp.]
MKSIFVIGDVMLDEYKFGKVNRISPEAPVPIFQVEKTISKIGGAGNVYNNLISIGGEASLFCIIGDDYIGQEIKKSLTIKDKNYLLSSKKVKSIKKTRVISQSQQLLRIDFENKIEKSFSDLLFKELIKKIEAKNVDLVIVSDYSKGTITEDNLQKLILTCKKFNIKIIIDPKNLRKEAYKNSFLLKPNRSEFEKIFNIKINAKNFDELILDEIKKLNIEHFLITMGNKGMKYYSSKGDFFRIDTHSQEVFDVTGAGDTVIAVLSFCISLGIDIKKSIEIANKAASITINKLGAVSLTKKELIDLIKEYLPKKHEIPNLIKKEENYQELVESIRKMKNVVFTNGCFDIIHQGHLKLLEEASLFGDILVVGINTDESVKKLKGNKRPINNLESRIKSLKSIKYVDFVLPFNEEDPLSLIKSLKPKILIKGSDYNLKDIIGSDFVKSYGGIVKTVELLDGFSTSNTIKKIKNLYK